MIYLDYAACSPPYLQVVDKVRQLSLECFGNPGGLHAAAGEARHVMQQSRKALARLLKVQPQQIFFTSGATEANNWAIKTAFNQSGKRHMIVSASEHSSVLSAARYMQRQGYSVSYVKPDADGLIHPQTVEAAVRADTGLICVQGVNNETGVMQDVAAIANLAKSRGILYLCDAVQSFAHCRQPLEMADLVSLSAHKLGGPRAVGCLVSRKPHLLSPFIHGGGQELGYRSGTENVAGIAGFALAAELSMEEADRESKRLNMLSDHFISKLRGIDADIWINGGNAPRRPGILSCYFPGISGEELIMRLDLMGICASPGSACAAREQEPSHVLLSMGFSPERARNSVRFSFGRLTTEAELDETARAIEKILKKGG